MELPDTFSPDDCLIFDFWALILHRRSASTTLSTTNCSRRSLKRRSWWKVRAQVSHLPLFSTCLYSNISSSLLVYSCALLRDILLQGRLYISRNWLCFYANLFGKDIKVRRQETKMTKNTRICAVFFSLNFEPSVCMLTRQVCIPVVSVRLVKKHKTAGLVPNGLAITMDTGQKVEVQFNHLPRVNEPTQQCQASTPVT